MSKQYFKEGSALAGPITPPQSPGSAASPSLSPELLTKVNDWVNGQPAPFFSESTRKIDFEKKAVFKESSPEISPDRKRVHWTPNVQDNQGKTIRKPIARQSRPEDKTIVLSSKDHRRTKTPLVPEPPRSRGPPPAPRPRRLPTPDLPDLKCDEFCDCCYNAPMSKMSAQLAAAASHISNTRQSSRRLI